MVYFTAGITYLYTEFLPLTSLTPVHSDYMPSMEITTNTQGAVTNTFCDNTHCRIKHN